MVLLQQYQDTQLRRQQSDSTYKPRNFDRNDLLRIETDSTGHVLSALAVVLLEDAMLLFAPLKFPYCYFIDRSTCYNVFG